MPRIKQSSIEELRARADILDVVGTHVQLEQKGNRWWGLSPFANEKTPSFSVEPDKGLYYCFSSGQGGDVFRFIQEVENLTFYEALEALASRFNVELEYEDSGNAPAPNRSQRREIEEMNSLAADYFHRCFHAEHDLAQRIRAYWTDERKFPLEIANEFKIGFAPPDGGKLLELIHKQNYTPEAMAKSGLFHAREGETDPRRFRPFFRGRLMIPIHDIQDRIVGFTARQSPISPENDMPGKYVNTTDTPLFQKSRLLFNLNRARRDISKNDTFLLVEGQLDAIRCWQHGLRFTVAPQGTGVTEEQMRLLARFSFRLDCLLDGDSAGQKAAIRAASMALRAGLEIRFLPLPENQDPDDLLREQGADAIQDLQGKALPLADFLHKYFLPKGFRSTPRERSEGLRQAFEVIGNAESGLDRAQYVEQLARQAGIELHLVQEEFERFQASRRQAGARKIQEKNAAPASQKLTTAYYDLLLLLFHDCTLARKTSEVVDSQWIDSEDLHGRLLLRIFAEIREGEWNGTDRIDELIETEEERDCVYSMLGKGIDFEPTQQHANECLRRIFTEHYKRQRDHIGSALATIPNDQQDRARELQLQLKEIRAILSQPPRIDDSDLPN